MQPKAVAKSIAIVGAGISGLLACKYTMEMGFSPIVFEARNCIGGVWSETIASTKLQTPKYYYQFSDFEWPSSVKETFPNHNQVLEYIKSYALHFNLLPNIKFNARVLAIDYFKTAEEDTTRSSPDICGGNAGPFSHRGKWNIMVEEEKDATVVNKVYQVDFVILCIGRFSDLPKSPKFSINQGPEVFGGEVLHSMDYAALDDNCAVNFTKDKKVVVVGFQKSAVDIASEISMRNGRKHPCTLLFRRVHWTVSEELLAVTFRHLNRFSELMVHKPGEGILAWLLALLFFPMLWVFSKASEWYLKWVYPLKKHNMVPYHSYLKQISSCMFTVLPANFYDKVREGSLMLKKSRSFSFYKDGLVVDGEALPTDIVIFATGYKSGQKIKNIFASTYFEKCMCECLVPLYRECIHPHIPQLAILGYADSPSVLYTTEMRSRWLSYLIAGKFTLPPTTDMEEDTTKWEKWARHFAGDGYRKYCTSVWLQIYCNDQLCKDMGCSPRRKTWFFPELFAPYGPMDYKNLNRMT